MARANRHFLPGLVWHITHRCHKKEFLLRFRRDRHEWLKWLYEAKKRFGLCILDYMVTSNHIHLLVWDNGERDVIPRSIHLVACQTGQRYNRRKNRKGAYWEDRYHATAVDRDSHLIQCIAYIDLNMVRAGVVDHPSSWPFCGFNEIQNPPQRKSLINFDSLMQLLGVSDILSLQKRHMEIIEETIARKDLCRQPEWTESIAVGRKGFVEKIKSDLGIKASGRRVVESSAEFILREGETNNFHIFRPKKGQLGLDNRHFWRIRY